MSNPTAWLIRHGESTINAGVWTNDPHSASLTDLGKKQAEECALKIDYAPDLIITSPATRALETAQPIIKHWPASKHDIWPIQEIVYLSPSKLENTTLFERKKIITDYWDAADPFFCDGLEAESFSDFLHRVQQFDIALKKQHGFTVVIGHGQFFKAYLMGQQRGFVPSKEWMRSFREEELKHRINNTEIIKLNF